MIKLDKIDEPNVLHVNGSAWQNAYQNAKAQMPLDSADLERKKYEYRHPDIKAQLEKETGGKCAYCETKILHVHHGETDHIVPVSVDDTKIFVWENLTFSCEICNHNKSNAFSDNIINPYATEPDDHLVAVGPRIESLPGDIRGFATTIRLKLNRPELIEKRQEHIDKIQNIWELALHHPAPLIRKTYEKKLAETETATSEYAMVSRAYITFMKNQLAKKKRREALAAKAKVL